MIAVAAGLALTGAYLWERGDKVIESRDVVALIAGTIERCESTMYDQGIDTRGDITNAVLAWSPVSTSVWSWVWNDTNGVGHVMPYYAVSGTNSVVRSVTNRVGYAWRRPFYGWRMDGSPAFSPWNFSVTNHVATNRYVVATNDAGQVTRDAEIPYVTEHYGAPMVAAVYRRPQIVSSVASVVLQPRTVSWHIHGRTENAGVHLSLSGLAVGEESGGVGAGWLDDSAATCGVFVGWAAELPELVATQIWQRAGMSGMWTNASGAFYLCRFSDEGFYKPATAIVPRTTNAVFNSSVVLERAKVLTQMRWSHARFPLADREPGLAWSAQGVTNDAQWSGAGNSYGAAYASALTNVTYSIVDAAPLMYARALGTVAGAVTNYTFTARSRFAYLTLEGRTTNIVKTIDWYTYSEPTDQGGVNVWNDNGQDIVTGAWHYVASSGAAAESNTVSGSLGPILLGFPSTNGLTWPMTNAAQAVGYRTTGQDAVMKWRFGYCTNAL